MTDKLQTPDLTITPFDLPLVFEGQTIVIATLEQLLLVSSVICFQGAHKTRFGGQKFLSMRRKAHGDFIP
jgi:hypothetical protein